MSAKAKEICPECINNLKLDDFKNKFINKISDNKNFDTTDIIISNEN